MKQENKDKLWGAVWTSCFIFMVFMSGYIMPFNTTIMSYVWTVVLLGIGALGIAIQTLPEARK